MEFISDRDYCITLKGGCCDIIVQNVNVQSVDKHDESLYKKKRAAVVFHMKILLSDLNPKEGWGNISQTTARKASVRPESNGDVLN